MNARDAIKTLEAIKARGLKYRIRSASGPYLSVSRRAALDFLAHAQYMSSNHGQDYTFTIDNRTDVGYVWIDA